MGLSKQTNFKNILFAAALALAFGLGPQSAFADTKSYPVKAYETKKIALPLWDRKVRIVVRGCRLYRSGLHHRG